MASYVIGVDFGSASVRSVLVDSSDGRELSSGTYSYRRRVESSELFAVRQDPGDYLEGLELSIREAVEKSGVPKKDIKGIGIDTTGSTIMPVDKVGSPLYFSSRFSSDPNAAIWLWKDHTSVKEADTITRACPPEYLAMVGGSYTSELYWSKVFHCLHVDPELFSASWSWVEVADWLPFVLTGKMVHSVCAAGHKALYNPAWGGYPPASWIASLAPRLLPVLESLQQAPVLPIGKRVGMLSHEWASKLGLSTSAVVSVSAFDAHTGGVGAGVRPGVLVRTIGTSTCDLAVKRESVEVPGAVGVVKDSIVPGFYGIEAGQSSVGDAFDWFVHTIAPKGMDYRTLAEGAEKRKPGESGLLALDWFNGNRSILLDQNLSALVMGMTLDTTPSDIYRALLEATAYGAKEILLRLRESGVPVGQIVVCGGIPRKDPFYMQLLSDVLAMDIHLSRNKETCALGSAIAAAVAAEIYPSVEDAIAHMTALDERCYHPDEQAVGVYETLYGMYDELYQRFGKGSMMKRLLALKKKD